MSYQNPETLRNLALFVYEGFKLRAKTNVRSLVRRNESSGDVWPVCPSYDHLDWCVARRRGCLGRFVLSFLLPCRCCAFSLTALLRCGYPCLLYGLAYCGGIACPVFVADTVWACVMATLNLRINFRSGVWVGCPLCFAVFAAGMVSVVLLGCGWVCMVGLVWL